MSDLEVSVGQRNERDFREEFLTCSLCSEAYDQDKRIAKYLPCLHTFCKECLTRYIYNQHECLCPVCRKKSTVPENGVDGIPNNFTVENLKEYQAVFSKDTDQKHGLHCTSCEDGLEAEHFCHDCGFFLCKVCTEAHRKMRQLKGHTLSSIDDLRQKMHSPAFLRKERCDYHKGQDMTLYCMKCAVPVCNTCAIAGHERSEGHLLVDLAGEIEHAQCELKEKALEVGKQEEVVARFAGQFDTEINALSGECTTAETMINESFELLKAKLDDRRESAITQLRQFCQAKAKQIRLHKDGVESIVTQIQSACEFAERACNSASPTQLLGARNQVLHRLHELSEVASKPITESPKFSLALHAAHYKSIADIEDVMSNIGRITTVMSDTITPRCEVRFHDPLLVGRECFATVSFSEAQADTSLPLRAEFVRLVAPKECCDTPSGRARVETDKSAQTKWYAAVNVDESLPLSNAGEASSQKPPHVKVNPCQVELEENGTFTVAFVPEESGSHALTIMSGEENINGGYVEFEVDEENTSVSANVSWKSAFPEIPHIVNVDTAGNQEEELTRYETEDITVTAKILTSDGHEIPNRVRKHPQGRFSVKYTPILAGEVKVSAFINNRGINGNPFIVNVQNLSPGFTSVTWDPCPVINQIWRVYIATENENGEALVTGGRNIIVKVTDQSTRQDMPCALVDNGNGTYTASLIPRKEVVHLIRVILDNMLLGKGVYEVYVCGSRTVSKPELMKPTSLAICNGDVCLVDADSQSIVSPDTKWQKIETRRKLDAVSIPSSKIAFDNKGRLLLMTPRTRRVYTKLTSGTDMWTIPDQVVRPTTLNVTKTAQIIIGDSQVNALFVFSIPGCLMRTIRLSPGCMSEGVDNVCVDGGNNILVCHGEENSIFKIDREGNSERILQMVGKQKMWLSITSTPENTLLISQHRGNILVVDLSHGTPVFRQEIQTGSNFSFHTIAVNTIGGYVLALDDDSKRVLKYGYRGCLVGDVTDEEARGSESSASATVAEVRRESCLALVEDVF